jgi:hypothetical protein
MPAGSATIGSGSTQEQESPDILAITSGPSAPALP